MRTQLIILIFLFPSFVRAQMLNKQDAALIGYNVGFGAISAGIGGVINKPRDVKWHKAFLKSAWQGSIGGALSYTGKKMNTIITRTHQPLYGWPSKIVHAAGTSIIYSAALNKQFLKYWNIDYGPLRFDFAFVKDEPFRVRFMPGSINSIIASAYYGKLDIGTSLACGNIAFKRSNYVSSGKYTFQGIAHNHTFMYVNNADKYSTIAHELNHLYQFRDYLVLNTWLEPLAAKGKKYRIGSWLNKYIYLDIPYMNGFYVLEGLRHPDDPNCYYDHFYEFEAERLSSGKFVYRCK